MQTTDGETCSVSVVAFGVDYFNVTFEVICVLTVFSILFGDFCEFWCNSRDILTASLSLELLTPLQHNYYIGCMDGESLNAAAHVRLALTTH